MSGGDWTLERGIRIYRRGTVGVPWGYVLMTFRAQRRVKIGLVNG